MKNGSSKGLVRVLFIVSLLAICGGCATSAPSRFYQLSSLKNEESPSKESVRENKIIIAVGPVHIPDYLDRPEIVTRTGENKMRLADFDRWAGSLDQDISRVLVDDLSQMLASESFYVASWVPAAQPHSYRVEVNVIRFEGELGGFVQAKAQWALFDKNGGMLLRKDFNFKKTVSQKDYASLVAALSSSLSALGREISEVILMETTRKPGNEGGLNNERPCKAISR